MGKHKNLTKTGGMQKGYKYKRKRLGYNNTIEETLVGEGDKIPDGFIRGRLKTGKPAGNSGLTKYSDSRVLKISNTIIKKKGLIEGTDEYIISLLNEDLYNYGGDNGKTKTIAKYKFPKGVWEFCAAELNMIESKEHRDHMKELTYTDEGRAKQSEIMKGKNTGSKGHKQSDEVIKNGKLSYSRRSEEDKLLSKLKEYKTKKKNNSFNTSRVEDDYYEYLKSLYSTDDIVRQYSDTRYPFSCDFYIKSEDKFIELNINGTHGPHPFDPNNEKDIKLLELGKSKDTDFYRNAINTWTVRDVHKMKTASENNLNYEVIYNGKQ